MPALLAPVFAFAIAMLIAAMAMQAGILDHPNERSNHASPTPRGGGLGILAGFYAALAIVTFSAPGEAAAVAGIVLCGGLAAGMGLLDDLFTLSETVKFIALVVLSTALAAMAGPVTDLGFALPWSLGLAGSALWIFTLANAVNFMDGSDGLMAAALIPAALALAAMGEGDLMLASVSLAFALAGFAVFNAPVLAPRGQVFAGDVGSLGAAVMFAGLALYWAATGPDGSVFLAPLLVLPLLGDVLLTMAARARAGRRLFSAHRAHAYQLLIRMEWSHRRVALVWAALSLACGALALIGAAGPAWLKFAVLVVGVAGFTVFHRIVRKRAAAAGLDITQ